MKPKEIREKLNITAERIKFYKREGVFFPENPSDGKKATNYTERDLENLRILEVLTKSGLTCSDIKILNNGTKSLKEVAMSRIDNIVADIDRKNNSLKMLSNLINDDVEYQSFDAIYYWNIINFKESNGEKFIEIEDCNISFIRDIKCPNCKTISEVDLEDYIVENSSFEKENGMGPDLVYEINSENIYNCSECHTIIHIEGWIREYPLGTYDSENIKVEEL